MRILLVEDEPKMAAALARGLRHHGYAVDTAEAGPEALLQARVNDPADRERVRQVVANLMDNAVKYSHAGGEVNVATWRSDDEVGVSVADAGVGIPADSLPQVFDRFYRADGARMRARGGNGLGLAICWEIAVAHGGRVWAESEEGCGSRFSLALPA